MKSAFGFQNAGAPLSKGLITPLTKHCTLHSSTRQFRTAATQPAIDVVFVLRDD